LSILLLLLLAEDRGADYVRDKVLRVFTFGSPPVLAEEISLLENDPPQQDSVEDVNDNLYASPLLEKCGLPSDIVYGVVQPWDPIVRMFTPIDPLYPLIGDIGEDGVTPYASGPPRTLRPIVRKIVESWKGWPRFRDVFKSTCEQNFTSVGVQHLLLAAPMRYTSDRLVSIDVSVPPIKTMARISSKELLPALESSFPLDTFRISFLPAATRGFIHHFYPAYDRPIWDYAEKTQPETKAEKNQEPLTKRESHQAEIHEREEQTVRSAEVTPSRRSTKNGALQTLAHPPAAGSSSGSWSPGNWLQFHA